jgi:COP9 signalosome complex subunit 12
MAWLMCHKDARRNLEYVSLIPLPKNKTHNLIPNRLILTYLIPCRLLTSHKLPSEVLLAPYPRLQELFLPLAHAIRTADLRAFDVALRDGEDEFIKRRVYLTLERGRDIVLRNLLRKVFIAGGFEEAKDGAAPVRKTRIPLTEFTAAIQKSSGDAIDSDEVECLIANMIYKVSQKQNHNLHALPIFLILLQTSKLPASPSFSGTSWPCVADMQHQNLMKGYIAHERGIVVLSKSGAFPGTNV